MSKKLKILFLSAEVVPYSKTGGLADVAGSLPKALAKLGHEVVVATAKHGIRNPSDFEFDLVKKDNPVEVGSEKITCHVEKSQLTSEIPAYFITNEDFFDERKAVYGEDDARRFYLLAKAFLKLPQIIDFQPDIIHCNDWHTGLVPFLLTKEDYPNLDQTRLLFTIHNLEYQGDLYWRDLVGERNDDGTKDLPNFDSKKIQSINFMKRGILYSDIVNTVSRCYRDEALTSEYGRGLHKTLKKKQDRFYGVVNGIDYEYFNPQTDDNIEYNFGVGELDLKKRNKQALQEELGLAKKDVPLLGMVTRIVEQKGFSLIKKIVHRLLELDTQLAIVGEGSDHYKKFLREVARKYPKKVGLHLNFSEEVGSKIYAGSDIFLMPSLYEPCGLGQMIAMRYGSIPVVRETGGLFDTVADYGYDKENGNGFSFRGFSPDEFFEAVLRAHFYFSNRKKEWQKLVERAMKIRFDWDHSAKKYEKLYHKALDQEKARG